MIQSFNKEIYGIGLNDKNYDFIFKNHFIFIFIFLTDWTIILGCPVPKLSLNLLFFRIIKTTKKLNHMVQSV